jgi:hypothetical protein
MHLPPFWLKQILPWGLPTETVKQQAKRRGRGNISPTLSKLLHCLCHTSYCATNISFRISDSHGRTKLELKASQMFVNTVRSPVNFLSTFLPGFHRTHTYLIHTLSQQDRHFLFNITASIMCKLFKWPVRNSATKILQLNHTVA